MVISPCECPAMQASPEKGSSCVAIKMVQMRAGCTPCDINGSVAIARNYGAYEPGCFWWRMFFGLLWVHDKGLWVKKEYCRVLRVD